MDSVVKLKLVDKTIYDVTTIVRSSIVFRIVSLQCYNLCIVTLQHNDGNNFTITIQSRVIITVKL